MFTAFSGNTATDEHKKQTIKEHGKKGRCTLTEVTHGVVFSAKKLFELSSHRSFFQNRDHRS